MLKLVLFFEPLKLYTSKESFQTMANLISIALNISGNHEAIQWANEKFDIEKNNVEAFIKSFYKHDPVTKEEKIPIKWLETNVGSKWIYLDFQIDEASWKIHSGNHFPKQFLINLFKNLLKHDPQAKMEITYEDESYDPIGVALFKADSQVKPRYSILETSLEEEYPDLDPDSDLHFGDKLFFLQDDLLTRCYKNITNGEY